jgi:hypothetical protein
VDRQNVAAGPRRTDKSEPAFRSTGEVAAPAERDVPPMLFSLEPTPEPPDRPVSRQALQTALEEVRRELVAIRELLDKVLVR